MPLLKMRCKTCGSYDVRNDAWAEWNEVSQKWVLGDMLFDATFCEKCECECKIEELSVPTREELLEILDNVSAAAQNLLGLTVFGRTYEAHPADTAQRTKIIEEARIICDAELRHEKKK